VTGSLSISRRLIVKGIALVCRRRRILVGSLLPLGGPAIGGYKFPGRSFRRPGDTPTSYFKISYMDISLIQIARAITST